VRRSWTCFYSGAALMLLAAGAGGLRAQTGQTQGDSPVPADTKPTTIRCEALLPDGTQGFLAISNVDTLSDHWDKTQLGHLMADPAMQPFTKDIRRQFEEHWSNIHERLGMTLDNIREVAGGDTGIGLIAPKPGMAALAIVIDVSGKLPKAKKLLNDLAAAQEKRGAKRSTVEVKGCPEPVLQFDLPVAEEDKEAGRSTLEGSAAPAKPAADADQQPAPRRTFYCLTGNLLVATDDPTRELMVLNGILGRFNGSKKDVKGSLADRAAYQKVVARCKKDYAGAIPQIRWFLCPLGYAEASRAATPAGQRRKGKSLVEILRNQGVGAVQGIGGFVDFASEGYELVHRTAICAPKPYINAMRMAELPNGADFVPQRWVSRDVATYTTFYFDILNAFDNFGPLFDELFWQGERGGWAETLKSLESAKNGVPINLRKEMFEQLGQRISVLTYYQAPITTASDRLLLAIEVKNAKAVASALEKIWKFDKTVQRREIELKDGKPVPAASSKLPPDDKNAPRRKVEKLIVWEFVPEQPQELPVPDVLDTPAVTPAHSPKKGGAEDEEEEEEQEKRLLPHAAMTVWEGHFMIASHMDFLMAVIVPPKTFAPLADDPDYRSATAQLDKFAPAKCLRFFSRTDEEYRPTYELIRQNKMSESESLRTRLLNGMFGGPKKGPRPQKIDGRQLPAYDVVRRYLGPAGLQTSSETDGWFLQGFTLTKREEGKAEGGKGKGEGEKGKQAEVKKEPEAKKTDDAAKDKKGSVKKKTKARKPKPDAAQQKAESKSSDDRNRSLRQITQADAVALAKKALLEDAKGAFDESKWMIDIEGDEHDNEWMVSFFPRNGPEFPGDSVFVFVDKHTGVAR
jgi:hypothetical protein